MKINIRAGKLDLTPSIITYIENKFGTLSSYLKSLDEFGQAEVWVVITRTTRHHRRGMVYGAAADLRLTGRILRAEDVGVNMRSVIDSVKKKLRLEIEKYKTRFRKIDKRVIQKMR